MKIVIEVNGGPEFFTTVIAENINEAIDKLIGFHTITSFEEESFKKRGIYEEVINSGWYYVQK